MNLIGKMGETISQTIEKVNETIEKVMESKYKYDYKKDSKKRLLEEIEKEKLDDSPRYKCDNPSMSVQGYIDLLSNLGYKKGIEKWNIWFPEGYNNIDIKIKDIKIDNDEQVIFTIPGCDNIVSKYNVWKSLYDYYGREKSMQIVPESFLLDKKQDIQMIDNQPEGTKFILKKKKQRKEGLLITSDINVVKEGYKDDYMIAQKLIKPFLVNNRKVNLRVYLMVNIQGDKLVAYVSKFGSCIYTKDEYDHNSDSFETNVTSYKMSLDVYKKNPLSFEQLKTYLKDNGYDPNIIFDKIKETFVLFLTAMKSQLGDERFNKNLCSQVFGVDFIVDEQLNPFLLECNKGPEMKPKVTSLIEPEEATEEMINNIENLKKILLNGSTNIEKIRSIKKSYTELYKGYPKPLKNEVILEKIENFYKEEQKLNSYPSGYRTGNGLKVQKDALDILGIIEGNENNGFKKILEL